MDSPLFEICKSDTSVQSLLGEGALLRMFRTNAPQDVAKPYVVYRVGYGGPENYLSDLPDVNSYGLFVEVYGGDWPEVREVVNAIISAVEPFAHVTNWVDDSYNPTTKLYKFVFIVDWIENR